MSSIFSENINRRIPLTLLLKKNNEAMGENYTISNHHVNVTTLKTLAVRIANIVSLSSYCFVSDCGVTKLGSTLALTPVQSL